MGCGVNPAQACFCKKLLSFINVLSMDAFEVQEQSQVVVTV